MPLTREQYGAGNRQPRRLRDFNQIFTEWYDPRRRMTRVRMLSGDTASVEDALDMIEALVAIHQAHFEPSITNSWHIRFPYMLVEPVVGDKILNLTTDEVYAIAHINRDPYYQSWDQTCILEGYTAPTRTDRLQIIDKNRLIRFRLGYPMESAEEIKKSSGELGSAESGNWVPTITARLRRKEPASTGKYPFAEQKALKPQLFETFRDPTDRETYSLEIWRQAYDNLVQFECWDVNPLGALRLAEWLEEFMRVHIGTLRRNGVGEILFWDQRDQDAREQWREGIVSHSVRYVFRTETLSVVRRSNLRKMSLHLRVVKHNEGLSGGSDPSGDIMWFGRVHNTSGDYLYGTFDIEDHGWAEPITLASNTGDPFDGVTGQFETRP